MILDEPWTLVGPVKDLALPPRSRLVRLEPIGLGSPYVESLSSYYMRLSALHGLSPQRLAREIVFPERSKRVAPCWTNFDDSWKNPSFNGARFTCGKWVLALEGLTRFQGLHRLTLLFLLGRASTRGLMSITLRWCPACIQDGTIQGTPYSQLLWSIQGVRTCPLHQTTLVDRCRCGFSAPLRSGTVQCLPHICHRCAESLSLGPRRPKDPPTPRSLRRSKLVADLLVSDLANGPLAKDRGLADFLTDSISWHCNGNAARLGHCLGVRSSTLNGWTHGTHFPDFRHIISIAEAHACSIADVLCGRTEAITQSPRLENESCFPQMTNCRKRSVVDWNFVAEGMKELLAMDPPISLLEASRRLRVSSRQLRMKLPEPSLTLSAKWKSWRSLGAKNRSHEMEEQFWVTARRVVRNGARPTWRRLHSEGISLCNLRTGSSLLREISNAMNEAPPPGPGSPPRSAMERF
jgi:hypothetical protein